MCAMLFMLELDCFVTSPLIVILEEPSLAHGRVANAGEGPYRMTFQKEHGNLSLSTPLCV